METLTKTTTRGCDDCGQMTAYEPIAWGQLDLAADLPHYCADCAGRMQAAEQERAAARLRERREAAWVEAIPAKYRETEARHPDFNRKLWDSIRLLPLEQSLGLIGPAGRCKTRVLALTARRVIASDLFVGWCPATSFQWAAQSKWDREDGSDAKKWLKRWQDCGVLFLDDLGKHRWTEAVESEFFALIDLRSSRNMTTHWTMNPLPADESRLVESLMQDPGAVLARALDPTGEASTRPRFAPIVSRLIENSQLLPVP